MYHITLPVVVSDHIDVRCVTHSSNKQQYVIVNYTQETDTLTDTYGKYRSVIVNPQSNQIVGFSPPTSFSLDGFVQRMNHNPFVVEELVDGIMMNVAWDSTVNDWIISTKRTVDAANSFLRIDNATPPQLLFIDMFMEALAQHMVSLETLSKQYLYSFVMRHPANRIVTPVIKPLLYLVRVYEVNTCDTASSDEEYTLVQQDEPLSHSYVITEVDIREHNRDCRLGFLGTVYFPRRISQPIDSTIKSIADNYVPDCGFHERGISIYCPQTGMRTSIVNPQYEYVGNISGNLSNLEHKYITLVQSGNITLYLYYYPEHASVFNMFSIRIKRIVSQLYMAYVDCFIKKKFHITHYSQPFKHHLYQLHCYYKTYLRPYKLFVTYESVNMYIWSLPYHALASINIM